MIYHKERLENISTCSYISSMKPKTNKIKSKKYIPSDLPLSIMLVWNHPYGYPCGDPQLNQREFWKITYITQGTGIMLINGKRYPISAGSICLVHPNDQTTWELQTPIQLYNILFMYHFIEPELKRIHDPYGFFSVFDPEFTPENSLNHPLLHLLDAGKRILNLIKRMHFEYEHMSSFSEELLRFYLLELLIALARRSFRSYHQKRREELIEHIRSYLQKFCMNPLNIRQIAEETGYSYGYLQSFYKQKTGESIGNTLLKNRLRKAQELLCETDLPIEQLCRDCGFPDPSDFYRIYKRETGETPGKWRKRSRQIREK